MFRPGVPLHELTVVPASPAQVEQFLRACYEFEPWAGGMGYEEFKSISEREHAEGEWAKDHGDMFWVLVRVKDPLGEVFSGCETHRTKCLVCRPGQRVDAGWVYGVTSVITSRRHRQKGYATRLLRLLHYILAEPASLPPIPATWSAPPPLPHHLAQLVPKAVGSILWSDIGSELYERCSVGADGPGWTLTCENQVEVVWKLRPPDPARQSSGWEPIPYSELESVAQELSARRKDELEAAPEDGRARVSLDPMSPGTLTMLAKRGTFGPQPAWRLAYDRKRTIPLGFRKPSGSPDRADAIILFALHNYQAGERLLVTFADGLRGEDVASLLPELDDVASGTAHTEGWAWGLDPGGGVVRAFLAAEGREARVGLRIGKGAHLLMDVWYGEGRGEVMTLDKQMWTWL